jgi:hypothetical protein
MASFTRHLPSKRAQMSGFSEDFREKVNFFYVLNR